MTTGKPEKTIPLDQWRSLSERVGGNLFRDTEKLMALRSAGVDSAVAVLRE